MNRREAGGGFRRVSHSLKDRDEELSFFRDLKKREKDQAASLLQPVSEEFEPNGSFRLSRMNSGGRKGAGLEFLPDPGKNDYNWLKTPPATPLFPSLEMETIGQELVIQRELPIIQPLSRFAEGKNRPTTPDPKPKLPQRHKTPTGRPSISLLTDKINMKTAPLMTHKSNIGKVKPPLTTIVKSTVPKESHPNYNMSRTSTISQVPNQTTNRPTSATANRPASATRGRTTYQNVQKQETNANIMKMKRQSCSPSVSRGRKLENDNRMQVVGSGMVDKLMNARMLNAGRMNGLMNERQSKIKLNSSLNETSGFGRFISANSLDMALKHKDIQRDSSNGRKIGIVPGRKY